ncbi:MAG TPA: ATP-dependent helicase HrpB [bacterium]|nr:ATP-dependent helicase HrpB [bacterium]
MPSPLPIDALIPEIKSALRRASALILQATPGSGKTTRVPPALLSEPWADGKEIWVLVPRRLAAKMAAMRVAEEAGEKVGGTVGYHFRFERVAGPKTRLKFLTEGMFLRLALGDPKLPGVAAVVLDEFHERHLQTDVALGYLQWLRASGRPDLKAIVMSATLPAEALARFLEAPVLSLETRLHPVSVSYLPPAPNQRLEAQVRSAVETSLAESRGDLLVFLPGVGDIVRSEEMLKAALRDRAKVLPLYADLSGEAQAEVFLPASRPKVILATNVAETSLTIDGVTTVIDSGLHRRASFSWWSGLARLVTRPISKASAIQRAGRAGRTSPGHCLRLYAQSDFDGRPDYEVPEIRRSDLAETALQVMGLGISDVRNFPWFEPPSPEATEAAGLLLKRLGAVKGETLTDEGRRMMDFPLHPRFGRAVLEAVFRGVVDDVATLAAWVAEGETDALDVLDLRARKRPAGVERLRRQILSAAKTPEGKSNRSDEDAARCLLAGFPDRVAKKRDGGKGRDTELVFATEGSAVVARETVIDRNEVFAVLDVQERGRQGEGKLKVHVHTLCPVRADWLLDLNNDLLREEETLVWDKDLKKVYEVSRLAYGELILSEDKGEPRDAEKAAALLFSEAFGLRLSDGDLPVPDLLKALERHVDPEPVESLLTRLRIFSEYQKERAAAYPETASPVSFLLHSLKGLTSLKDLKPGAFHERMEAALPPALSGEIDRALPTHIALKDRRVKVHYRWDQKPWIASRLQDFFGMREGPSLMGGRLPLTLHLLAPNQRPVQVTQDLASFWKNAYPPIRKELSRKYPRHKWPEDPLQA